MTGRPPTRRRPGGRFLGGLALLLLVALLAGYGATALVRVWHMRRDMALWWPWYERRRASAHRTEVSIDPERLTVEVREMMKQPASFAPAWRASLGYPMRRRLALTTQPCLLMTAPEDVFATCVAEARAARPDARVVEVEDSPESRARAIRAMLGDSRP